MLKLLVLIVWHLWQTNGPSPPSCQGDGAKKRGERLTRLIKRSSQPSFPLAFKINQKHNGDNNWRDFLSCFIQKLHIRKPYCTSWVITDRKKGLREENRKEKMEGQLSWAGPEPSTSAPQCPVIDRVKKSGEERSWWADTVIYPGLFFFLLFGLGLGSSFSSRYCTTCTSEGTLERKSSSSLLSMV